MDEELFGGFVGIEEKLDDTFQYVPALNSEIVYSPRRLVM